MLLFVTDWELLLVIAVGESAVSGSVHGLLLYGAYKVNPCSFGHSSLLFGIPRFLILGFILFYLYAESVQGQNQSTE
jgi:hypothetical protein